MPPFETEHPVTFGDCDPAGILFYPNHFRLMDATFQRWLASRGTSQRGVQERFGAVGTGLIEVEASFRRPVVDGDVLRHVLTIAEWNERTLAVTYAGVVAGREVVRGRELRGLFVREGSKLTLAPIGPLREALEGGA